MNKLRIIGRVICAAILLTVVLVGPQTKALASTTPPNDPKYHQSYIRNGSDFPAGWCTPYAAIRFSERSRAPGVNWNGNAIDWYANAQAKGWTTTSNVGQPQIGAIVVWSGGNHGEGHVAVVEQMDSNGIMISEMNWVGFNALSNETLSWGQVSYRYRFSFEGYIYPGVAAPPPEYAYNFFPFVCIANANNKDTTAEATFYDENGEYRTISRAVPANSRITVDLNADPYLRNKNLSIKVRSLDESVPILAERPMYFRYHGWMDGGSDALGVTQAMTSWYFAEGYASDSFDEYICLGNFGDTAATGTMTLFLTSGPPVTVPIGVAPKTRQTYRVNTYVQGNVSLLIQTNNPVTAERSMYFRYYSRHGFYCDGGHTQPGLNSLSKYWYLAEGHVASDFEEWILLANPNPVSATATVTYYTQAGKYSEQAYQLAPNSRYTVYVNDAFGKASDVSASVTSEQPIAVERSMYFNYNGWANDGHVSAGVTAPSSTWYFAEGSCFKGINEYLLLANPGDVPATVTATYLLGAGMGTHTATYVLGPESRVSIYVDSELSSYGTPAEVGLKLSSDQPVVAERSMYFNMGRAYYSLKPICGGHDSLGATQPAVEWLFSEAYTGN